MTDSHVLQDGRTVKLGKLEPKDDPRTLRLARYLERAALPGPPESLSLTPLVARWGMLGNDRLGDCTAAAAAHMLMLWTAASGHELAPSEEQVVHLYSAVSGYDATTGQHDDGAFELDVLNYWRHHGLDRQRIFAFAAVDPKDLGQLRQAMALFDGVYVGIGLPRSAQQQIGSIWDVVSGPDGAFGSWGGHAVPLLDYDPDTFTCITWGAEQRMTAAFVEQYVDEAYAIVPTYWRNHAPHVDGFKFDLLVQDLKQFHPVA